ncbi:hypothetical protein ACJRO7_021047 [Eucalyptus globulus]|uniref:Uncharacterized protein n=1 Tax=Eucalyptus globulus TaxID=34317 RepID=A0ABD3KPQ7_EUCGL
MARKAACLCHVSRESSDFWRFTEVYKEILGLEDMESPKFEFKVIWPVRRELIQWSIPNTFPEATMSASPSPIRILSCKLSRLILSFVWLS